MLTYNQFNQIILTLRELDGFQNRLYEVGVYIEAFNDLISKSHNAYGAAIFNSTQSSIFDWWLYEAGGIKEDLDPAKPMQWDENGQEMPIHTVRELYDYLMTLEGFKSESMPDESTSQFTILFPVPKPAT